MTESIKNVPGTPISELISMNGVMNELARMHRERNVAERARDASVPISDR